MTPDAAADPVLSGRKVLILVSEDWYFCSHRLPIGVALRKAGADVVVATRVRDHGGRITEAGLRLAPIGLDRSGLNPLRDLRTLWELLALYRRERPDLTHHVAMKPTLYGSLCAWLIGVPAVVNAIGGLGFLFIAQSAAAKAMRGAVRLSLRFLMNRPNSRQIQQNPDDIAFMKDDIGVRPENLVLIRGAGVDIDRFKPAAEPSGVPVAVCVSRMLYDKGVGELVAAARLLKERGVKVRIRLVGATDDNPTSVSAETLARWAEEGVVDVAGHSTDIAGEYARAHIAVLPSYREGLPKSLLEAAAAGRPMVAADAPGCREVCRHEETGLLAPARSVEPLADALQRLATDAALRRDYGAAARRLAVAEFSDRRIVRQTLDLYRTLLADRRRRPIR